MPISPEELGTPIMLTLRRRIDRLGASMNQIAHCDDWPFARPEVFYGFDGRHATRPGRVQNQFFGVLSAGGWGCTLSYTWLVNQFLQGDDEWLFILEDDLWLVDDFGTKVRAYLDAVPDDADSIYIGGNPREQIKYPPVRINDLVCRPYRVTATHCFAMRRSFVRDLEPWLLEDPQEIMDQRISRLHALPGDNPAHGGAYNIYFPLVDLAGQVMGLSDIADRDRETVRREIWGVSESRREKLRPLGTDVTQLAEKWRVAAEQARN